MVSFSLFCLLTGWIICCITSFFVQRASPTKPWLNQQKIVMISSNNLWLLAGKMSSWPADTWAREAWNPVFNIISLYCDLWLTSWTVKIQLFIMNSLQSEKKYSSSSGVCLLSNDRVTVSQASSNACNFRISVYNSILDIIVGWSHSSQYTRWDVLFFPRLLSKTRFSQLHAKMSLQLQCESKHLNILSLSWIFSVSFPFFFIQRWFQLNYTLVINVHT